MPPTETSPLLPSSSSPTHSQPHLSNSSASSTSHSPSNQQRDISDSSASPSSQRNSEWKSKIVGLFTIQQRNKGLLLILAAEIVGASMDATARYLQQSQGGRSFDIFQVVFFRMSITWLLSTIYMWWTKVPDFPFGNPSVRVLLFLRSLFGFLGLLCLYYSVHYLTVTEATIVRFLVPLTTTLFCSILLSQPFTSRDVLAGLLALGGVVIMAHPESIFGPSHPPHADPRSLSFEIKATPIDPVSPTTHILSLSAALLGVFFAAGAYTCIRLIGSRAHALISVSYFSNLATVFSFLILTIPLPFPPFNASNWTLPQGAHEWGLLLGLGVSGFILQFLLTSGLQMDKSSRATSMLYLQVVLAALWDWGIWGVLPKGWSWVGGGIVVGSTLWLALSKNEGPKAEDSKKVNDVEQRRKGSDEERGLLANEEERIVGEDIIARRASISA